MTISGMHPGDQIDHYRIDEVVAHNAIASLMRATDLQTGHTVALKVPRFEIDSEPVLAERFEREAEIAHTLVHPGIMKVLAAGSAQHPYLVTEWFDGVLLRQLIAGHDLPQERAVRIARALCSVLGALHAHGIVHRDLRPEGILVDAADHVKLIDFGIASLHGARRITFTSLSQVVGTSAYLSPEEARGKRGDLRSDIYALGVILYEMLTGALPFQDEDPFAARGLPRPPRELNPAIPPQLQEVAFRALEPGPRHRYTSALEFAHDLAHLDAVGVEERPELAARKNPAPRGGRRALWFALLVAVPLLLFLLLFLFARQ